MSISDEIKAAGLSPRVGLVVFLKNISDQYKLRRFGDIVYFSKKMKYCMIYVDQKFAKDVKAELSALNFVSRVEFSNGDRVNFESQHIEKQLQELAQKAEKKLQENNGEICN